MTSSFLNYWEEMASEGKGSLDERDVRRYKEIDMSYLTGMKFYGTTFRNYVYWNSVDINDNGVYKVDLTDLEQGTGVNNRVGRQISIRYVEVRMMIYSYGSSLSNIFISHWTRAFMFVEYNSSGYIPSIANIMNFSGYYNLPLNPNSLSRYKLLTDDWIRNDGESVGNNLSLYTMNHIFSPLLTVTYSGSAFGSALNNVLYLFTYTTQPSVNYAPVIQIQTIMYYTDD